MRSHLRLANARHRSGTRPPGVVYDPGMFWRDVLLKLTTVKFMDIAEGVGCSKVSASDITRGKWTPHVSTCSALAALSRANLLEAVPDRADN